MEKTITILSTENLPIEDYFKGNHEAHKVAGLEDTYAIVRPKVVLDTHIAPPTNIQSSN